MTPMVIYLCAEGQSVPDHVLSFKSPVQRIQISSDASKHRLMADYPAEQDGLLDKGFTFETTDAPVFERKISDIIASGAKTGIVIYHYSASTFHLAERIILGSDCACALVFESVPKLNWTHFPLLSAARGRFCLSQEALAEFKRHYVFDATCLEGPACLLNIARKDQYYPEMGAVDEHRVLLISYYTLPARTVAALRLDYWWSELPQLAKAEGVDVATDLLTACCSPVNDDSCIQVADSGEKAKFTVTEGELYEHLKGLGVNALGLSWASDIRRYFETHPKISYDTVILSGNPFLYFGLGEWFAERWGANIVLDYRDPFAHNPRFIYTKPHKAAVVKLEKQYNASADLVLTVNEQSLSVLDSVKQGAGLIVANGYDDRAIPPLQPDHPEDTEQACVFVHLGTFTNDRSPSKFIKALKPERHKLVQIGPQWKEKSTRRNTRAFEQRGYMEYSEAFSQCAACDAGLIITKGAPFEQTTKIFDYIAAGIDIIIITDGKPMTGNLHRLTYDLDRVYWVQNSAIALRRFLKQYKPGRRSNKCTARFSRKHSTKVLLKGLLKLELSDGKNV